MPTRIISTPWVNILSQQFSTCGTRTTDGTQLAIWCYVDVHVQVVAPETKNSYYLLFY